jgi:CRISPR/Cas system CSM-associated protein Csm3 (group 7 of RAMP superfamily)
VHVRGYTNIDMHGRFHLVNVKNENSMIGFEERRGYADVRIRNNRLSYKQRCNFNVKSYYKTATKAGRLS